MAKNRVEKINYEGINEVIGYDERIRFYLDENKYVDVRVEEGVLVLITMDSGKGFGRANIVPVSSNRINLEVR